MNKHLKYTNVQVYMKLKCRTTVAIISKVRFRI